MGDTIYVNAARLEKTYRLGGSTLKALDQVDLAIARGEFTGIVGPSGSGKTTLLNIIGSLDVPTSGSIERLGESVACVTHTGAARLRKKILELLAG